MRNAICVLGLICLAMAPPLSAVNNCTFTYDGDALTMTLTGDCTTDATITIPDGHTLMGGDYTITAIDPDDEGGTHFVGAVIGNGGTVAHVTELTVAADALVNACDGGADRLRGIMFEGASGSITHCTVTGINQGASGCQEGNAIEIRNAPFDGTHPNMQDVAIEHNTIRDYQKSGIVCNGDVYCTITNNDIGESATQENLAANSVQVGFGAAGVISLNQIEGNQWMGLSNYAATAVLVYLAGDGVEMFNNRIRGNSDIGIYFYADDGRIENNKVFDQKKDHPNSGYDIGIGSWGEECAILNNKIRGFDVPLDGSEQGNNKFIPSPQQD